MIANTSGFSCAWTLPSTWVWAQILFTNVIRRAVGWFDKNGTAYMVQALFRAR